MRKARLTATVRFRASKVDVARLEALARHQELNPSDVLRQLIAMAHAALTKGK